MTNKRLSHQLDTISRIVQGWLDSQAVERTSEGLPIDDNTHLMRVPEWPSRGMLKAWVQALTAAAGAFEACQHLSTVGFDNKERCLNCGATMVFGPDGLFTVEPNPGSRKTNSELANMLDRAAANYHDSDFWLIQVIREVSAELRRAIEPKADPVIDEANFQLRRLNKMVDKLGEPPAEPKCPCGTAYLRVEGGYVPVCYCAVKNSVTVNRK